MSNKHRGRNSYPKHGKAKEQRDGNPQIEDNPILKAFHQYSIELDDKHDRYERLVKLSRDITIESKRIIFLLHNIDGRKNNKDKVLEEAEQRLNKLISVNFKAIAKELQGQDPYQFRNAYSPGLQEFIEAFSFMEFFRCSGEDGDSKEKKLSDWSGLQSKMQYEDKIESTENMDSNEEKLVKDTKYEFFVEPTEYILGLSDLTGELMRRCINSLGSGETEACVETCKALQEFYTGYISLSLHCIRSRDISRKIFTMRQSVLKAENVCYNVKVRGGEAAKWGSVFDHKPDDDLDEGFF